MTSPRVNFNVRVVQRFEVGGRARERDRDDAVRRLPVDPMRVCRVFSQIRTELKFESI